MTEYLVAAWESVTPRAAMSLAEFMRGIEGADVYPVSVDGVPVGAVIVSGPEVHACVSGGYGRWFKREHFALLASIIKEHGYAQTSATTEQGRAFVERLGFKQDGEIWRLYGH